MDEQAIHNLKVTIAVGLFIAVVGAVAAGVVLWALGLNGPRNPPKPPTTLAPTALETTTTTSTTAEVDEPEKDAVSTSSIPPGSMADTTASTPSSSGPSTTATKSGWTSIYGNEMWVNDASTAFSEQQAGLDIAGEVYPFAGQFSDCLACEHEGQLDLNLLSKASEFRAMLGFTAQSPPDSIGSWQLQIDGKVVDEGTMAWGVAIELSASVQGSQRLSLVYAHTSGGDYSTVVMGHPEVKPI